MIGLEPYTDSGNPEWDKLLRARQEGLRQMIQLMSTSILVRQQAPGLRPGGELAVARPLMDADPQEQAQRQLAMEELRPRNWNELLGAADTYGIRDPERWRPEDLEAEVEMRRGLMRSQGGSDSYIQQLVGTLQGISGMVPTQVANMTLEALGKIPFMGDALARTEAFKNSDRFLASIEESLIGDFSVESFVEGSDSWVGRQVSKLNPRNTIAGGTALLGYIVPAGLAWAGAGRLLYGAAHGTRAMTLGRATVQGLVAETLIEGGGDAPLEERALNIALGTAGGVLLGYGLPILAQKVMAQFRRGRSPAPGTAVARRPPPTVEGDWYMEGEGGVPASMAGFLGAGNPMLPPSIGPRGLPTGSYPVGGAPGGMPRPMPGETLPRTWEMPGNTFVGSRAADEGLERANMALGRETDELLGGGDDADFFMEEGFGHVGDNFEEAMDLVATLEAAGLSPEDAANYVQRLHEADNLAEGWTAVEALAEATALSRTATIMESPALPEFAARMAASPKGELPAGALDDADAAQALMASFPGQVAVLRNVGDVAKTVRRFLQEQMPAGVGPQDFRVVQRPMVNLFLRELPDPHGVMSGPAFEFTAHTPLGHQIAGTAELFPDGILHSNVTFEGSYHAPQRQRPGVAWTRSMGGELVRAVQDQTGRTVTEIAGTRVSGSKAGTAADPYGSLMPAQFDAQRLLRRPRKMVTDILVTSGRPISNKMVKEYEETGFFSGQRVIVAFGQEAQIISVDRSTAVIADLADGHRQLVDTAMLMPTRSSGYADMNLEDMSLPTLYSDFVEFAQEQLYEEAMNAGIRPLDIYGDEATTQLPRYIDEYIALQNSNAAALDQLPFRGYHEAVVRQLLELEHLRAERKLIPEEDAALLASVLDEVDRTRMELDIQPTLHDFAEARLLEWVPGVGERGVLRRADGTEFPMENEEAAVAFLWDYDHEVSDVTPALLVAPELVPTPVGPTNISNRPDPEDFVRDTEAEMQSLELYVEELEAQRVEAEGGGGAGGAPPPPFEGSLLGEPSWNPFPRRLGAGNAASQHDAAWFNLRRDSPDAFTRMQGVVDGFLTQVGLSFRHAAMRIEAHGLDLGFHTPIHQTYDAVETAHTRAMTQAIEWEQKLNQALSRISKNRWFRDGTFYKVYTEPSQIRLADGRVVASDRQAQLMSQYGFTPADRAAMAEFRGAMDALFASEVQPTYPNIGYIPQFWPSKVSFERTPGSVHLPNELTWSHQLHRRGGGQIDTNPMSAFGAYVRSFFKYREMKPAYENMREMFDQPNVPPELKDFALTWLEARFWGLDASTDKVVQGIRRTFGALGAPLTTRDVTKLLGTGIASQYRGMLGGRFSPLTRETLQLLVPASRLNDFPLLGRVLKDYAKSTQARVEMYERALEHGWLQREHIDVPEADILSGTAWEQASGELRFSPAEMQRREFGARIGDVMRDMMPRRLRSGIAGSWIDPLKPYQGLGNFQRVASGEMGWRKALGGIARYRETLPQTIGEVERLALRDQLLKDSGVLLFQASIKREFMRLVDADDDVGAAAYLANKTADLMNRYGATQYPPTLRDAGLVGRLVMQLGSHSQQQVSELVTIANDTSIPRAARRGYYARMAAIDGALLVGKMTTGWDLKRMMLVGGLASPLAAPTLWALANDGQRLLAKLKQVTGDPLGPDQTALLASGDAPGTGFVGSFNPYAGAFRTATDLPEQIFQENPVESTLRYMSTGQRGNPVQERMGWSPFAAPPERNFGPTLPGGGTAPSVAPGSWGSQNIDSILAQYPAAVMGSAPTADRGVADSTRVRMAPQGYEVYDTPNQTPDGKVPTHRLDVPSGRMPGETWEMYEQRVLVRPAESFPPETQSPISSPETLEPETQAKVLMLIELAASQGIGLRLGETLRTADRQEWLFQQGRSRPGPVVTWTLTSNHADGRAADLVADTPEGYNWIQQMAPQIGLGVLGPSDPGHVFTTDTGGGPPAQGAISFGGGGAF